jgi:hypothetical protein
LSYPEQQTIRSALDKLAADRARLDGEEVALRKLLDLPRERVLAADGDGGTHPTPPGTKRRGK